MTDWRSDRIGTALRGENPTVMTRLPGGFAVIGDVQWLPGYCVLLTDDPEVTRLTDLPRPRRLEFLDSMERLGSAVERACAEADPDFRRVNLEILGNTDPFLHAHIWPRYEWEPPDLVGKPVWLYPPENWTAPEHQLGPEHDTLRTAITKMLSHDFPGVELGPSWDGIGSRPAVRRFRDRRQRAFLNHRPGGQGAFLNHRPGGQGAFLNHRPGGQGRLPQPPP